MVSVPGLMLQVWPQLQDPGQKLLCPPSHGLEWAPSWNLSLSSHPCSVVHACLILWFPSLGLCSTLQVLEMSPELWLCLLWSQSFSSIIFSSSLSPLLLGQSLAHRIPRLRGLGLTEALETRSIALSGQKPRDTHLHTHKHMNNLKKPRYVYSCSISYITL